MNNTLMMKAAADAYRHDRLAEAARGRLIAIATGCRPSTIPRAARAIAIKLRAVAARRELRVACCA